MPASDAPLLELIGIGHRYRGVRHGVAPPIAVADVSLNVAANEVVCLLGPSGCGKSTLLRIAAGLEPVQKGRIRMSGRNVADPAAGIWTPPERRHVGLVFQDSALFPHLSVLENVAFGLDRLRPAQRQARALALLEQLHVGEYAHAYPHRLSGGQQQRVALARALAPAPSVMLLDEPFSGLDARLRDRIRDDTLQVLKASGAGTLLVTHDPEEAMFMADRIALMRSGRIVQIGAPAALYYRPKEPFVVKFFGGINELSGVVREGLVTTPVGTVAAKGLATGERVTVLIRPEALGIGRVGDAAAQQRRGHVVAARLLGRDSLVQLRVNDHQGRAHHLQARMPGTLLPQPGQVVGLALDKSQVFVFPARGSWSAP
ncbi:MAG: ABC transporter ATP-binding protein [Gammaproteobacteria bacterium]